MKMNSQVAGNASEWCKWADANQKHTKMSPQTNYCFIFIHFVQKPDEPVVRECYCAPIEKCQAHVVVLYNFCKSTEWRNPAKKNCATAEIYVRCGPNENTKVEKLSLRRWMEKIMIMRLYKTMHRRVTFCWPTVRLIDFAIIARNAP